MTDGRLLVLYDGVCGLCNMLVQFLVARDRADRLRFAPLQGDLARRILVRRQLDPDDLDTMVLVEEAGEVRERVFVKGRAALRALVELGGRWRLASALGVLPAFLLDAAYDLVALHRYRLFGKYESCLVPLPHVRTKFLEV